MSRSSVGSRVWLSLAVSLCSIWFAGCSGDKGATPGGAAAVGAPALELHYVGDKFVAGIVARPADALKSPIVTKTLEIVRKHMPGQDPMAELSQDMKRDTGLTPEDIDQVAILMDGDIFVAQREIKALGDPPEFPRDGGFSGKKSDSGFDDEDDGKGDDAPKVDAIDEFEAYYKKRSEISARTMPTIVIRTVGSYDPKGFAKMTKETTEIEHGGKKILMHNGRENECLCFADDRTIIIGRKSMVEHALDSKDADSPLKKLLVAEGRHQLLGAIDLDAAPDWKEALDDLPPPAQDGLSQVSAANQASFTLDLDGPMLLALQMRIEDEESAKQTFASLEKSLADGRKQFDEMKKSDYQGVPEVARPFQALAEEVVTGANVTRDGPSVKFSLAMPKQFEKLPEMVEELLAKFGMGGHDEPPTKKAYEKTDSKFDDEFKKFEDSTAKTKSFDDDFKKEDSKSFDDEFPKK